jgi:hypothetical protein
MRKQIHQMFQGLMFLHGHVVLPEQRDADFAPLGNRSASARWFEAAKPARDRGDRPAAPTACATC